MSLKQVRSYQTSDGKLFEDRAEALTHELTIDIRGVIQSNTLGRAATIGVTDVAQFVASHAEEIYKLLTIYRDKIRRMKKTS